MTLKPFYQTFETKNDKEAENASKIIGLLSQEVGINFAKKVMDVGFGIGHKSYEMKKLGADLFGVEPLEERFRWAIEQMGFMEPSKAFNCLAQDLPIELFGTFDIVTMFKYRIIPDESLAYCDELNLGIGAEINGLQLQVNKILAKLLNPNGILVIEILNEFRDNYLFYPDHNCTPLMFQLKKLFQEVEYVDTSYGRSIFIIAKRPYPREIVDQVSNTDVILLNLILKYRSLLNAWKYLLDNNYFYTGIHNPNDFVLGERSLSYVHKNKEQI